MSDVIPEINKAKVAKPRKTLRVKSEEGVVEVASADEDSTATTHIAGSEESAPAEIVKVEFPHVVIGGYTKVSHVIESFGLTQDDPQLMANSTNYSLDSGNFFRMLDQTGNEVSVELPYGVVAIYGVSNSGKSELAKQLAYQLKIPVFRFQEPEIPSVMEPHVLIAETEKFLTSRETTMIVDSFRFFVYNTAQKSAAGKGGVNTKLYSDLTSLSVCAAFRRKTIIVVVNPMSDDDSAEIVFKALEGSIAGLFRAKGYGNCDFGARTSSSQREMVSLRYAVEKDKNGDKTEHEMAWMSGAHAQSDDFASKIFRKLVETYKR